MTLKIQIKNLPTVPNICNQILREVWKSGKKVSIAHVIMKPKNISLTHKHKKFTEIYYILSGNGLVGVGNFKAKIQKGDAIYVPKKEIHALKNTNDKILLKILAISSPPYSDNDIFFVE